MLIKGLSESIGNSKFRAYELENKPASRYQGQDRMGYATSVAIEMDLLVFR
jgi:hypothetical protein